MKYVAAASDKTVSFRRGPLVFRIVVKWNIASLPDDVKRICELAPNLTTDEHGFDRLKHQI